MKEGLILSDMEILRLLGGRNDIVYNAVDIDGVYFTSGGSLNDMTIMNAFNKNTEPQVEIVSGTSEDIEEWSHGAKDACVAFRQKVSAFIKAGVVGAKTERKSSMYKKGYMDFCEACKRVL